MEEQLKMQFCIHQSGGIEKLAFTCLADSCTYKGSTCPYYLDQLFRKNGDSEKGIAYGIRGSFYGECKSFEILPEVITTTDILEF